MADRVKRREIPALVLVGVCSALGLAMGCTGGRAFLKEACSTFRKPPEEAQRWVDEIAIVMPLEVEPAPVPPRAPAPVLPLRPLDEAVVAAAAPAPALVSSVSLRGPPRGRVSSIGHTRHARTGGDECPRTTEKVSGSS